MSPRDDAAHVRTRAIYVKQKAQHESQPRDTRTAKACDGLIGTIGGSHTKYGGSLESPTRDAKRFNSPSLSRMVI